MYTPYEQYLNLLRDNGKCRRLGIIRQERALNVLDFSTNDYLNLSQRDELIKAAEMGAKNYGVGSTGSRLLSGNLDLYDEFERTIASDKKSESSLIFNSGFQANISTLSCLLDDKILHKKPLVFLDKLSHSSLYQAIFLSKAEICRYHHNDMNHLESLLIKHKDDPRPKFIVTETVFGMDGDICPLEQIVEFAYRYNTFLYLDEAHATGVLGIKGYGLSTTLNLKNLPHIIMGTFSKALGVSGAYVACHKIIRDFLINKATGFIYSTAPSPVVIGAAFKAWGLIKTLGKERQILQNLGKILRKELMDKGFDIGLSQTHIIPIILKDEKTSLKVQEALFKEKIIVSCIRPPTVPPGTSRLRIALQANHQLSDLKRFIEVLEKVVDV